MYYSFWIDLPESNGKFAYEKHGGTTYVKYEIDSVYDSDKKIFRRKHSVAIRAI